MMGICQLTNRCSARIRYVLAQIERARSHAADRGIELQAHSCSPPKDLALVLKWFSSP